MLEMLLGAKTEELAVKLCGVFPEASASEQAAFREKVNINKGGRLFIRLYIYT